MTLVYWALIYYFVLCLMMAHDLVTQVMKEDPEQNAFMKYGGYVTLMLLGMLIVLPLGPFVAVSYLAERAGGQKKAT